MSGGTGTRLQKSDISHHVKIAGPNYVYEKSVFWHEKQTSLDICTLYQRLFKRSTVTD